MCPKHNAYAIIVAMTYKNVTFARNLVKGKIAETIFAQMLRETGQFTVLEFGYEKVIPELVGMGDSSQNDLIETLRTAPDFAVIDRVSHKVHLIEVKYQRHINASYVLADAKRMHQAWNPSYLFIATLDGFYFGEISQIIANNGVILPLETTQVPEEMQNNYLKILQDFESDNR